MMGSAPAQTPPDIREYIKHAWTTLERSVLVPNAYHDVKIGASPLLYMPQHVPEPAAIAALHQKENVAVVELPRPIQQLGDVKPTELSQQGLLYLPNAYVVPGGMFNEMYGWDSYFIMRGLLADHEVTRAQNMLENYFFEVENYGAILNANRTYYLTRSQPPFLTSALLAVHAAMPAGPARDQLLQRGYELACKDWQFWTTDPNLADNTGLSRYFDVGNGPVPEMGADQSYYEKVATWVSQHPGETDYVDPASPYPFHLSADYFKGDRAMRASGFDVSFRFGPFSGATHHYAPVCLNSLLYKAETDLANNADQLGRREDAGQWRRRATFRRDKMNQLMWNPQVGMYFDYDFVQHRQSSYHYVTTFYPLWAGLASPEQAAAVMKHLPDFEQAGGLAMSNVKSGAQWDLPYGWAPTNLLAVEGMARYGFKADAARVAGKFDDTVRRNYQREGTIHEKYDVVKGSSEVNVEVGYAQNVVGFGWTNAAYLELLKYIQH